MRCLRILVLGFLSLGIVLPVPSQSALYRYGRIGNAANSQASPRPGFALMGGGEDLDDAFRFLCIAPAVATFSSSAPPAATTTTLTSRNSAVSTLSRLLSFPRVPPQLTPLLRKRFVTPDGIAKVIGRGGAWFIDQADNAGFTEADRPIEMRGVTVRKVVPTHTFNLNTWAGDALSYKLSVEDGVIHSTQPAHAIY